MVKKIVVVIIAFAFIFSAIAAAFANDVSKKDKTKQAPQLVALLPDSDGIMTLDVQRLLDEALPQILSGNQPKLNKIMGELDKIKEKTGFDMRRFEKIAVGVKTNRVSANNFELEPVLLARGAYDSKGLVGIAKIASKGKYKTEKVGNRTIYIFSIKEIAEENKPKKGGNSITDKMFDKMFNSLSREIAVTSYDNNTLALGTLERVKETLNAKSRVSDQLTDLVYRKQNAVMSFGMNMPQGMSKFFEIGNEEIDSNIDSIRQLYGSMNIVGNNSVLSMTARTNSAEEAENLHTLLSGLKELGDIFLGGSKGGDKQIYSRMIKNTQLTQAENEVIFNLEVPQSDIDVLIGEKK